MTGAFADIQDRREASEVDLSENVVRDFVEYHRGEVVGHEQEGLLMYLSMLTGWAYDPNCHNNVIGQGPPGSGKSLTKNTVGEVLPARDTYTKTDASSNAILDSRDWDLALVALMDEYDKVDKNIIEVLKSSNPEDGGYAKDRNVEDPDARGGYAPVEVSASANPWVLLYAPSSKKGGINDELEDRALILYFSNSKHTRRGIGRKEFGHDNIDIAVGDGDHEYIYDVHGLAARLRQRIRELPVHSHYETDDGEEYVAKRTGETLTYMPRWVWYAAEPIFNLDEDHTNRVYGIVSNLMKASALLNHDRRQRREVEVYVDEDSTETETREAVVVAPQDVANVLACLPTLLSTTHELTPIKRHVLDAVDATQGITEGDGTTVQRVREWLDDNDIPHPAESTLRQKMNDLAENYYLHKWENAGGPNGRANVYELRDEGALQTPNIQNLQAKADRDGIDLTAEGGVEIDPVDPFADCTDPIRDQPFKQTVYGFDDEFSGASGEDADTSAAQFMTGSDTDTDDSDNGEGGQQSALTDVDEEGVEADADAAESGVDLDPDADGAGSASGASVNADSAQRVSAPEGIVEQAVYEALCDGDHDSPYPVDAGVGTKVGADLVDPDHDLWDSDAFTDDRIVTETDARREVEDAYENLLQTGLVAEDGSEAPPKMVHLRVADAL